MNRRNFSKNLGAWTLASIIFLTAFQNSDALAMGKKRVQSLDLQGWYSGSVQLDNKSEKTRALINQVSTSSDSGDEYYPLELKSLVTPDKTLLKFKLFVFRAQITALEISKDETTIFSSKKVDATDNGQRFSNGSDTVDVVLALNGNLNGNKDSIDIKSKIQGVSYSLKIEKTDELPAASTNPSIDEVMAQAKWKSFSTRIEAEKVFQAKQNINKARGALIPGLSLKAIVGVFTGDYLSVIGAAAPFLFPSNWFALSASKALYGAEKDSYVSIRGNTMNMVEGLYYVVLRDKEVLDELTSEVSWMENILKQIQTEERLNTLPVGSSDYFASELSAIKRDQRALKSLVQQNFSEIAQIIAVDPINGITALQNIPEPDLVNTPYLDPKPVADTSVDKSYELAALSEMKRAAKFMMYEGVFSFLSPEGGTTLGFGTAAQVRFSKSQQRELDVKIEETKSILAKSAKQLSERYNGALDSFQISLQGATSVQNMITRRIWQHAGGTDGGENDFAKDISENVKKLIEFKADRLSAIMAYRISESQKRRLVLEGYYNNIADSVPAF